MFPRKFAQPLFSTHSHLPNDLRVAKAVEEVILDLKELPYPAADVAGEAVAGRVFNPRVDHANGAGEVERVVRRLVAHDHAVSGGSEPVQPPAQRSKIPKNNGGEKSFRVKAELANATHLFVEVVPSHVYQFTLLIAGASA